MNAKTTRPTNESKIKEQAAFNTQLLVQIFALIERDELNPKLNKLIKDANYGDWYWQFPEDVQKSLLEAAGDIREIRFMLIRALGFKPVITSTQKDIKA